MSLQLFEVGTGDQPREPDLRQIGYRPPPASPGAPDTPAGRHRWSGIDLLGGIGLSVTASSLVIFAGAFVDDIQHSSGNDQSLASVVAALTGLVLSLIIIRLTSLPLAASLGILGLATAANVLVHFLSNGGANDLLGLPPSFMEQAIAAGIPFGVTWLYVSRKYKFSFRVLGFFPPDSPTAYLYAFGAWFLALIGVGIWGALVTDIETITPPDNATPILEIAGGSLIVAWLLVGLWGPFVEEVFFRGFLLGGLRTRFSAWPALLISSGVFALFHILPGLYVPTFLLGLAFGWVYLKTRSIWPAIFGHTLHNTLVIVAVWQDQGLTG